MLRKETEQGLEPVTCGLASRRESMDLTLQCVGSPAGFPGPGESGCNVQGVASLGENWSDPRGGDT